MSPVIGACDAARLVASILGAALSSGCADPSASAEVGVYVGTGGTLPEGSGGAARRVEASGAGGVLSSGGTRTLPKPPTGGAGGAKVPPPPPSSLPTSEPADARVPAPDASGFPTLPTTGCLPGAYTGTFTCSFVSQPGLTPVQVQGTLRFSLSPTVTNPFSMTVGSGSIESQDMAFPFNTPLTGQLDCFTGAIRSDGSGGGYAAHLDGQLDRSTKRLSGLFYVSSATAPIPVQGGPPCAGAWSAEPVP